MDSVKIEAVRIKGEFPELELTLVREEVSVKQELCESQCDSGQPVVPEIKAEHNELEIPRTEEPLPVKQEDLEVVCIKWEPPEVEFDYMEPGEEESEDFRPRIPEPEPVCLWECSVGPERFCIRERGAGEEGSLNSKQVESQTHSECSLAGSSPAAEARADGGECPDSGEGFSQSGNLEMHQRTETGEKPYPCSGCGKSFRHAGTLKAHQRIHTGEKPYCCSDCGKSFSHTGTLKAHQRIHAGEKPYCCSDCGKSFSDSGNLRKHKRIHTGDKLYCCSDCGKSFSDSGNQKKHQRIHTGEKPYCCSGCGKSFSHAGTLKAHQRIHTGEKPYRCSDSVGLSEVDVMSAGWPCCLLSSCCDMAPRQTL
ncbi:zinc finger and SCAN domain-containing protein 21-like [Polyodon spathula]|uniref:zinc finger and SCAN domain-containing protein 21-like n=1 Tax=Polyodon spathula TaxID=7913 RepID=UPI001B7F7745|nr:zinc finger and SCAN domain-containing protein 21-like [Polyodon spathula]